MKSTNNVQGHNIAEVSRSEPETETGLKGMLSKHFYKSNPHVQAQRGPFPRALQAISPVLMKYKDYLKSCYKARPIAASDKYLPTLKVSYINLALVSKEHLRKVRDEFTRRTLYGGVDEILRRKSPICMEDLMTPENVEQPVKFILVEGPPGIGKSTFAWEVCRRWDEIESLRYYHTVVLLKLREKWVFNAKTLSQLFRCPFNPNLSRNIAEQLHNSHGQNLLLVLDGFDELPHNLPVNSVIRTILRRELLSESTIILTSRPSANHSLTSVFQPQIDKHIEIIGFKEEERVRYITEVFNKEPELQVNFMRYMFLVPHIKSMMYIPLNCAIIAQVYYESQSSHHLTIPSTRTQLYKALSHCLLMRHVKIESSYEDAAVLPEGLGEEDRIKFKLLAKFAFDSYHKRRSRQIIFFKEDIPDGLVHFGFMNESTEMYASKGVERIFSFLHLSLQEYLAAWHLADSYSIEFQVAYHRLAAYGHFYSKQDDQMYKGIDKGEGDLISHLKPLGHSLREPAIFMAGITGWICQSEQSSNCWEEYLTHAATPRGSFWVFVRSLYEAQNSTIIPYLFAVENNNHRKLYVNCSTTPHDCYALCYVIAHYTDNLQLSLDFRNENGISIIRTFVKGLHDHCKSTPPRIKDLELAYSMESLNECLFWMIKANFLVQIENIKLQSKILNGVLAHDFLKSMANLRSLIIDLDCHTSWLWMDALESLSELKILRISYKKECSPPPTNLVCWLVEHGLHEIILDITFPSGDNKVDIFLESLLKSILESKHICKVTLPHISRKTMAGVHRIIQNSNITEMKLIRTALGYDGILYICSALKYNSSLEHLLIDDLYSPCPRRWGKTGLSLFSKKSIPLPDKCSTTDFLLELNNILKRNTTLKKIKIQSGLFHPLSVDVYEKYCQWTGLGPLQQLNMGAVGSGMSPNLRRSFSSSDLTQPQTTLFWDRQLTPSSLVEKAIKINFSDFFSMRKEDGIMSFSLPSFTAPDTEILKSFSGLDPRLKECLEISNLHTYLNRIIYSYYRRMQTISRYIERKTFK